MRKMCLAHDTSQGTGEHKEEIAGGAYRAVRKHFEQKNDLSDEEKLTLNNASCIEDVQKVVNESLTKYAAKHESSKAHKWLQRASETICHYETILDVFVQHHPEYVSLVWGLMKLLFVGVVNHGETLKLIAKTISQVAERLPKVRIVSELYSTEDMRQAVQGLYSEILEFLLMARSWCAESKFRHLYHSITRPPALQYHELLIRITDLSNSIIELAAIGSQKEIRVMHMSHGSKLDTIISALDAFDEDRKAQKIQMDGLLHLVSKLASSERERERKMDLVISLLRTAGLTIDDLLVRTETYHSIQTSALFDTNQQLSDLQLSQTLSTLSLTYRDPNECYQHHLLLRNRRASGVEVKACTNQFWLSPKFRALSIDQDSAMVVIKGTFTTRMAMQDFAVDTIRALNTSNVPVAWALTRTSRHKSNSAWTSTDLIKYLTWQVLRMTATTEKQMALRHAQFQTSQTLTEWVSLFTQVVQNLERQVYLVVDLAAVSSSFATTDGSNIIEELGHVISAASQRSSKTIMKTVLLVYEANWSKSVPSTMSRTTIPVKVVNSKRLPHQVMKKGVTSSIFSPESKKKKTVGKR